MISFAFEVITSSDLSSYSEKERLKKSGGKKFKVRIGAIMAVKKGEASFQETRSGVYSSRSHSHIRLSTVKDNGFTAITYAWAPEFVSNANKGLISRVRETLFFTRILSHFNKSWPRFTHLYRRKRVVLKMESYDSVAVYGSFGDPLARVAEEVGGKK